MDGQVNQHFQVEAMYWRMDLSAGGNSRISVCREVLIMATPFLPHALMDRDCPVPLLFRFYLIKDPDTIFE